MSQQPLSPKPHFWQPLFRQIGSLSWGAKLSSIILPPSDKYIYRWSNGRTSLSTILGGVPIIELTTLGAKSGKRRTVALICIPQEEYLILIASNWGGQKHPAWYHNLKANPEAEVTLHDVTQHYVATEVFAEEREICWQTAVSIYPGYNAYAQRVNNRQIPVLKLTPVST